MNYMDKNMTEQINLSAEQKPDWALFLPAVSSFFISDQGGLLRLSKY